MLRSLLRSNPEEKIEVYVMHSSLTEENLARLESAGCGIHSVRVRAGEFQNAPVTDRYPLEMYYRIFAARYLPETLDRILYLDPDMIIRGSLEELYSLPMEGYYYAAATHLKEFWRKINEKRLELPQDGVYINSGVLLMNLRLLREEQNEQEVFRYIEEHRRALWLPDQDILSALYGSRILQVDPYRYNMTEKLFCLRPEEEAWFNLDWVREHSAIIHYCGRNKPWKKNYMGRLNVFYEEELALNHPETASEIL